ncbi:hypothetical protein ScPMuIL_018746 [Solemya velum]
MDTNGVHSFSGVDYTLFGVTVAISLGIGLYYALTGGRQRTTSEFILGNRQMSILPVTISLMVSYESSIMMLGFPAETYLHGAMFCIYIFGSLAANLIAVRFLVPLFHPLRLTSVYEYFELRYGGRSVRLLGTVLGILGYIGYIGIVLFGPGIALEAVTDFPLWASICTVAFASVIYTAIGGLKAVIWTDVFQFVMMFSGIFAIIIKGTMDAGGVINAIDINTRSGRMKFFDFDPDPRIRHTFWSLILGSFLRTLGTGFCQSSVQRISATETTKKATNMWLLFALMFAISLSLACSEGLVAYAFYHTKRCDPLASGRITNANQVVPYMVMDVFRDLPGMPGLFMSAVFSATLSTLSSALSSLSALTWEDIIKPHMQTVSEFKATFIVKSLVVFYGVLAVGIAFLISTIPGTLFEVARSLLAAFDGPLTGIFLLSIFFPWATSKGCFLGGIAGFAMVAWISIGKKMSSTLPKTPWLPLAPTDMCYIVDSTNASHWRNTTTNYYKSSANSTTMSPSMELQGLDNLYALSYQWLASVGIITSILVGVLCSLAAGGASAEVNTQYVLPYFDRMCCCFPRSWRKGLRCGLIYEKVSSGLLNTDVRFNSGVTSSENRQIESYRCNYNPAMAVIKHHFQIADYVIFGLTLIISIGIGVFHAFSGGRQRTTSEFLVGNRKMAVLPVAISLMVSFESSIMMLGVPAEIYVYGLQWIWANVGWLVANLLSIVLMVPLLHPLKITSAYEYLELRFKSRAVRLLGTLLGIINYVSMLYGVVLFGPAIALEAVTGFPQWSSIIVISLAAVIYTTIGGIKAVIWTDVFQFVVMISGMFAVLIKGTMVSGGIANTWKIANDHGRLNLFVFDTDVTLRHSFWSLFLGTTIRGLGLAFNQSTVQRISATPTVRNARKVLIFTAPGFFIAIALAAIEGIIAFAYYTTVRCDPLESEQIGNPNQIIPYLVMDIFQGAPGMPGLFLASLFSASLSTLSSGLSSLSALFWEDIVKPHTKPMSEMKATIIAKVSVIIFGIIAMGVAFGVALIGGTLTQIATSILSAFGGPLCGLFLLGAFCPWANAKGALTGGLTGCVFVFWIAMGKVTSPNIKKEPWLDSASTDQCPVANVSGTLFYNMTVSNTDPTTTTEMPTSLEGVDRLYSVSYMWLATIGIIIVMVLGTIVSLITGGNNDDEVDTRLMIPVFDKLFCCLPSSCRKLLRCGINYDDTSDKTKNAEISLDEVGKAHGVFDLTIDVEARNGMNMETEKMLQTTSTNETIDTAIVPLKDGDTHRQTDKMQYELRHLPETDTPNETIHAHLYCDISAPGRNK